MLLKRYKNQWKCKLHKNVKKKNWVSQAVIPPVYLPIFLFFWDRCALPHNPNILTFTSLSISKSSSFAGTVIRTLGVMTNGVGITQRWRGSALVNICKKRKMSGTAFFHNCLRIINKGSLPQRKVNFILPPFMKNSVTFKGKRFLADFLSP